MKYYLEFLSLEAYNALSYKHFNVNFQDQGLVSLRGFNGAGKTTIPTIIDNTLFFKTAKGSYKELINQHEGNNYQAILKFKIEGIEYVIENFMAHQDQGDALKLYRKGEWITQHWRKPEIKAYIPKLIGCDKISFSSTISLGQKHAHTLIMGTPREREEYITKIFGLDRLSLYIKQCAKEKNKLNSQIENQTKLEQELEDIEKQLGKYPPIASLELKKVSTKEKVEELKSNISIFETRKDRIASTLEKVKMREELYEELKSLEVGEEIPSSQELSKLSESIDTLTEDLEKNKNDLRTARKVEEIKEELSNISEVKPIEELEQTLEKVNNKKTFLQTKLPKAEKAKTLKKELRKIARVEEAEEELECSFQEIISKISKAERKIEDSSSQLKKGICPTCKRSWNLSEEEINGLKESVENLRGDLENYNKNRFLVKSKLENLRRTNSIEAELKNLPDEDPESLELRLSDISHVLKQNRSELEIARRRKELESEVKKGPSSSSTSLSEKVKNQSEQKKTLKQEFDNKSKAKDLLDKIEKFPSENVEELTQQLGKVRTTLKQEKEELEHLIGELSKAKEEIKMVTFMENQKLAKREELKQVRKSMEVVEAYEIFSTILSKHLRVNQKHLLKKLSSSIPQYLRPMFGEQSRWIKAEISKDEEGIDIRLVTMGKNIPQHAISEGQETKLGLATIFGLRDLYGSRCNLLILDEPLKGVDEGGLNGFVSIIEDIRKNIGTLIIISHEETIKGLNFDHVWSASISKGISTLELD